MKSSSDYLGKNSPLKKFVSGFNVRREQQELCDAIEASFDNSSVLVAEAGTGIGKTFAYLVPAILSGKKTIISTGTKHLQDQVFYDDLPRVVNALDTQIKTALLKGRANYLCKYRLNLAEKLDYVSPVTQHEIQEVKIWSKTTKSGDISELNTITEESSVWPLLTINADNCLGSQCDYLDECYLVKARREAQDADLLVINHHLLLADMALKEDGFGELLPDAEVFIIDEAHQLHDVASSFFGANVGSRKIIELSKDSVTEQVNAAPDMDKIREISVKLDKSTYDFRLALGDSGKRQAWLPLHEKKDVADTLHELLNKLEEMELVLKEASVRSRGLDQCYQRCCIIKENLQYFSEYQSNNNNAENSSSVLWCETYTRSFVLHATPIDISVLFQNQIEGYSASWLYTSATLQVDNDFSHFTNKLGINEYTSGNWMSPFNYEEQSLLYLPHNLPEPSDINFTKKLVSTVFPVLNASKGRAFFLFTSYRALNIAKDLLTDKIDYPLLVQGELPRHLLLEKFRELGNAILLGTSSFWEGVDVRGKALSCLIIDKLPFASPGDPVMQARIDAIKETGGQPFMDFQLPNAVISLKQGIGRLIRDVDDHGVVVIGDPRIYKKSYGKVFLKSIPPMPVTSDIEQVKHFYSCREESEIETVSC